MLYIYTIDVQIHSDNSYSKKMVSPCSPFKPHLLLKYGQENVQSQYN